MDLQVAQEQQVVAGELRLNEHTQAVREQQAVAGEPRPESLHQIHQRIEHAGIALAGVEAVAFGETPLAIAAGQAPVEGMQKPVSLADAILLLLGGNVRRTPNPPPVPAAGGG